MQKRIYSPTKETPPKWLQSRQNHTHNIENPQQPHPGKYYML